MRPFPAVVLAASVLTLTACQHPPERPVSVRDREPPPIRLIAANEPESAPQADPCADYDQLEAGTAAPERQELYNGQDARGFSRWRMACLFGWGGDQFACLDALWSRESGWNHLAHNRSSGAHGVPQALPGSKMGDGWWDNPRVQSSWGLFYIRDRWSTPCDADAHQRRTAWY